MTKKEVAMIKETIVSIHNSVMHPEKLFPPTPENLADWNARVDVLIWLLEATGHADCLDPNLLQEHEAVYEE